jgi:hypothetical protein
VRWRWLRAAQQSRRDYYSRKEARQLNANGVAGFCHLELPEKVIRVLENQTVICMSSTSRFVSLSALCLISLNALALPIVSGDGTESCTSYLGGSCNVTTIDRHPLWQTNGTGTEWISFGDTGWDGSEVVPNSTSAPAASFFETLTFTSLTELSLRVWGDDTVQLFLDDVAQNLPDFSQDICAGASIGCEPEEFGDFFWILAAGTYTVRFDVYQVGGGPFGLLYTGEANALGEGLLVASSVQVPEPGTMPLLAAGLLALAFLRRKVLVA